MGKRVAPQTRRRNPWAMACLLASTVTLGIFTPGGGSAAPRSEPEADAPQQPTPSPSPDPSPTTPTPTPTPTPSADPADTGSVPKVSVSVRPTPSPSRSARPTARPRPVASKTPAPTQAPAPTPTPEPTPAPAPASKVQQLVEFLRAQVGKPYVWGATGPGSYDCSGLIQTAFSRVGISLPRTSQDQSTVGTRVSLDSLQPGDVLFWGSPGSAYHDAVYVGDGQYVGAENPSTGVVLQSLSYYRPDFARRVL